MSVCIYVCVAFFAREHPLRGSAWGSRRNGEMRARHDTRPSIVAFEAAHAVTSGYAPTILVHFVNMGGSSTYILQEIITSLRCLVQLVLTTPTLSYME